MLIASVFILLIPLIGMQFTDEINWTFFDFMVAGVLLFGTSFTLELALRKVNRTSHRILIIIVVVILLILAWAELAVGIFGTAFGGS